MLRDVKVVLRFDCACAGRQSRTLLKNDNRCEDEEVAADGSRFLFSSKLIYWLLLLKQRSNNFWQQKTSIRPVLQIFQEYKFVNQT